MKKGLNRQLIQQQENKTIWSSLYFTGKK